MAFVPEGRCDRSLARSAWESATQKSRPVGYGVIRVGVGTDSMIGVTHSESKNRKNLLYDFVPTGISCARPYRWTMSQVAMQRAPVWRDGRGHCQSHRYLSSKLSPGISKRQRVERCCRFRNAGYSC